MATAFTGAATTRRNILETARFLFRQQGFDRTTLKDITEKLEVSESVITMYFASKDDLLEAVWSE
jgi:AcrR family transcriptional regulator